MTTKTMMAKMMMISTRAETRNWMGKKWMRRRRKRKTRSDDDGENS